MRIMRNITAVLAIIVLSAGCGKKNREGMAQGDDAKLAQPVVYTVNYPLQYMAQRISAGAITATMPAPADEDPAFWSPGVETITAYQGADLILLNGAGYATWVDKVSLPTSRMLNTGKAFSGELIALTNDVTHTHGPSGEHEHGAVAFTTWLDPNLAIRQAEAVRDALSILLPDDAGEFDKNFAALKADFMALDDAIKTAVGQNSGTPVIFSHPVYQYLTRAYGLNGQSVHWEPGEAPADEMWQALEAMLADHPAKWMIWEGDPLPATVAKLKTMGIDSVVFSPCGNTPQEGDYMSVMDANLAALRQVFGNQL